MRRSFPRPARRQDAPRAFPLDQVAELGGMAMADAGLHPSQIDGLSVASVGFTEVRMFVPAMVGEYLGFKLNYGEVVDLGGATVLPAFADCHVHVTDTGYFLGARDLAGARSYDEFAAAVARVPSDGGCVLAGQYDESTWRDGAEADVRPLERFHGVGGPLELRRREGSR